MVLKWAGHFFAFVLVSVNDLFIRKKISFAFPPYSVIWILVSIRSLLLKPQRFICSSLSVISYTVLIVPVDAFFASLLEAESNDTFSINNTYSRNSCLNFCMLLCEACKTGIQFQGFSFSLFSWEFVFVNFYLCLYICELTWEWCL